MRKYLIAVLLMVVAGVAVSLYLIPDQQDILVLQQKDEAIRSAGYIDYQAQYDAGNRSQDILIGLADIYIGEERQQEAIAMLEAYVNERPDALPARKKLAALYQSVGRDEDYLQQVEYVAKQDPSEENLKLLADMYNYVQLYGKQAVVLRQLIDVSGGQKPEYYVDLATILTLEERKGEAAGVIQELKSRHPDHISFKMVRLVVTNYVDAGEMDAAYSEAAAWVERESNLLHIADLANILNYGGRPEMALQLMAPYRQRITENDDLFTAYVNASINAKQTDQAYALMKAAHERNRLPASLYPPLMRIAVDRDEVDVAMTVVGQVRAEQFDEDQALDLLETARSKNHPPLLEALIALYDQTPYISDKNALAAVIALLRRDADEDVKIARALDAPLTRNSRIRLAQACARNDKETCFDRVTAGFPPIAEMKPRELSEVVDLYISVNREELIYDEVAKRAANTESERVEIAHMKLVASTGRSQTALPWLNRNGRSTSSGQLSELFFLANDRNHSDIAATIAVILYERDPSPTHRDYVISSYLRAGQYAKALPLLRQVRNGTRAQQDNYLAALTELGAAEESYRKELADYVLPQMEDPAVSSERKLQYTYMLLNTKNREAALPYIKRYAKEEGGEWQVVYNQIHSVGGKSGPRVIPVTERSRDFRVAMARDARTNDKTKRMLAFSLLEDGYKDDAVEIFYAMAQEAGPDSQEVKDLLFLWGPRLNEQQVGWLISRASGAHSNAERVRWGEMVANYGDDYALMHYVTSNPQSLSHPSIRRKYFNALAVNASSEDFDQGMRNWVEATQDPAALQDYADVAAAYGYQRAAIRALNKIHAGDPTNEKALMQLGILNYGIADYSEAERFVSAYLAQYDGNTTSRTSPYEVYYYQAELLRRKGLDAQAQQYFQRVASMAPQEADTVNEQSIYYTSLFYLGYIERGKQGFYGLLDEHPHDKALLADFISALVEFNMHDEALAVANQYDKRSTYNQGAHYQYEFDAQNIREVSSLEGGRELKIAFEGENQARNLQTPDWAERIETGYDSMLIAAKPGFELRFTPTSATTVAVLASGRLMTPQERLKRQQELRLQLLYARLELESGNEQQALTRLRQLRPYFPDDSQLIGYTANAENFAGNWPRALTLLDDAQSMTPENEDLFALRRDIERVFAEEVKIDHTYRRIGDSDEQITTLSGRVRVTNNVEIGGSIQNNELDASQVRRSATGNIEDFDVSRQRGELYAAYYFGNGDRLKGALFANNDTAGAGAYYAFNNPAGRTELIGEYKKPYWDFVEAVSEEATRSRVGARHLVNLGERTTVSGEVSVNQYDIAIEDDAASTVLIRANIVRRIRDENPKVAVGYGFDGEYLLDEKKRTLANGDVYRTFPIISREIHYPSVILEQDLTETTRGELVSGWAFDRLGGHGPQVEGKLTQEVTDDIEAQIRASYGLLTQDTDQNVTHVGGHVRYKF